MRQLNVIILVLLTSTVSICIASDHVVEKVESAAPDSTSTDILCTELLPDDYITVPYDDTMFIAPIGVWNNYVNTYQSGDILLQAFSLDRRKSYCLHEYSHTFAGSKYSWGKNELVVKFVEPGYEIEKKRVMETVKRWEDCCRVRFKFKDIGYADIRVSFKSKENKSRIGADSKGQPVSMWLALKPDDPDIKYDRIVLHEFGHAMGFVHEHQVAPGNPYTWDTAFVVAHYMRTEGWDSIKVLNNVIRRYSASEVRGTKFDDRSIMCYEIPAGFVKGKTVTIPANTSLSDSDKYYAAKVYK